LARKPRSRYRPKRERVESSGLDEFKELLTDFRSLSTWAVGVGVGAPFIAAVAALAPPPWEKQIALITAVIELVVLIIVFQFFASAQRRRVERIMFWALSVLTTAVLAYLILFNVFTFVIPTTENKAVAGFVCTEEAKLVYGESCDDHATEKLASMQYEAARLWESWSISLMTFLLTILWFLCFGALSALVGVFLVFQSRQLVKKKISSERMKRVGAKRATS